MMCALHSTGATQRTQLHANTAATGSLTVSALLVSVVFDAKMWTWMR